MKNLKPYLLASVCLNLVLIGLMVGGAWRGQQMRPQNGPADEIGAIMFSAPPKVREELRDKFKGIAEKRDRSEEGGPKLFEIIGQVPFEKETLVEFFSTRRDKSNSIANSAHESLVESIANLSDDERAELAENLKNRPMRRDREKKTHN